MKKDKQYIENISIIVKCDLMLGNRSKIEKSMQDCIDAEDYETCAGIKKGLNNEI